MILSSTIDWSKTIPWVFSGIGVALLSWLGNWLYKLYKRYGNVDQVRGMSTDHWGAKLVPVAAMQPLRESSQVNIADARIEGPVAGRDVNIGTYVQQGATPDSQRHDEYHEYPTPNTIRIAVDQAALYLRPSVESSYVGIKIRWQSKLRKIVPREKK